MQNIRIQELLHRVVSGYLTHDDITIKDPSGLLEIQGKQVYSNIIKGCFDLINDREVFIFLCRQESWNKEKEQKLTDLPMKIERLKIAYYESFHNPIVKKSTHTELVAAIDFFDGLLAEKNAYFNYTADGIATNAMWRHMIKDMCDDDSLDSLNLYHSNRLSLDDIRDLAVSNEWMSLFSINENVFNCPPLEMTNYQRDLIHWSKIYTNARSHPDCPSDKIFEDHLAFDGWMLYEQKQRAKDKKVNNIKGKNMENARNVFLVGSKKDAQEIYDLNDSQGKARINSIFNEVEKHGTVRDQDLTVNRFNK